MACDLEDALEDRLNHVNDWLRFAEKKNATLLVLNVSVIWGISRFLRDKPLLDSSIQLCLWFGLIAIGLSVLCCIFSLLPILQKPFIHQKNGAVPTDNSLYFGDIAKYDVEGYLVLIESCYEVKDFKFLKCHRDYVEQLIINSKITGLKYKVFNIASCFSICGFLLVILYAAVFHFWGKI